MYSSSLLERTSLRTDVGQERHTHGVFINLYVGGSVRKSKHTTHTSRRSSLFVSTTWMRVLPDAAVHRHVTAHDMTRTRPNTPDSAAIVARRVTLNETVWRPWHSVRHDGKEITAPFLPKVTYQLSPLMCTTHIYHESCLAVLPSEMVMNDNTGIMWEERVVAYFEVPFRYLVRRQGKNDKPQSR
jgi:hypothetical protein